MYLFWNNTTGTHSGYEQIHQDYVHTKETRNRASVSKTPMRITKKRSDIVVVVVPL